MGKERQFREKKNQKQGKSLTVLGSAEVFNTNITLPCPAAKC